MRAVVARLRDVGAGHLIGDQAKGEVMETININGKDYIAAEDVPHAVESDHVCVIATNGWIFEGYAVSREGGAITLAGASVVRRWDNGLGIGGIAKAEHRDDYTLDACGTVRVHAVVAEIALGW